MNKITKNIEDTEEIEESENNDDSSIEMKTVSQVNKERKKANYVFTDARKEKLEQARIIKMQKVEERKQIILERDKDFLEQKKELEILKEVKIKKSQKNKIKKLEKELKEDSENDEPIIKIRKPKKKTYVKSDSDSDNEKIVIKNNTKQNNQTDYRRLTTYI